MKRNYFLHRITGGTNACEVALQLIGKGYLSIGWSDFSSDEFILNVQNLKLKAIEQKYNSEGWSLSRSRWNLYRFLIDMKEGDYIVVPQHKMFSIYQIEDNTIFSNESLSDSLMRDMNIERRGKNIYQNNVNVDLGFYRKVVTVAKNIPRSGYADQKLISRMKIRQTNAWINDLEDNIEQALISWAQKKPIILKDEIIQHATPIVLEQIRKKIDDAKFEKLVEWYLQSLGAYVETPAKNALSSEEGDADKIAIFEQLKLVVMVQVKKHIGNTGDWAVQQIIMFNQNNQYKQYNNDDESCVMYNTILWIISSGDDFSTAAKEMARENNVRLINGKEFAKLLLENGIEHLPL